MTGLREAMLGDLRSRGVLAGEPDRRSELVDVAIAGGEVDGQPVAVAAADWRLVIAFLDARYADAGLLGGVLVGALGDPVRWIDLVACATEFRDAGRLPVERHEPTGASACVHGKASHEWCPDCATPREAAGAPVSYWGWSRLPESTKPAKSRQTGAQATRKAKAKDRRTDG